jgi:hypothetical protein
MTKEEAMYWFDADGKALDSGAGATSAVLQIIEDGKLVSEQRFVVGGPNEKSEAQKE